MNKKTSVLTLKLNEIETEELEKVKLYVSCKTSSGAIKKMIDRFILLEKEVISLKDKLSDSEDTVYDLEKATHRYFDSMHGLMKTAKFKHKL